MSDRPNEMVKRLTMLLSEATPEEDEEVAKLSILDTSCFQTIVATLVLCNCVLMGVEADHPEWTRFWEISEYFFTVAFTCEMMVKLWILRVAYFRDRWNLLDFALVLVSSVDVWIITPLGSALDMQALSILRILRLLRLIRVLRLFRALKRFVLILTGIYDALKATFWVGALMLVCIYVSAIFCTTMVGRGPVQQYPGYTPINSEIDENEVVFNFNPYMSFGSMRRSMLTLFNIAILAEWTEIVRPVAEKQPFMLVFFILFALVVCYGVMNVIIGMIVESVIEHSKEMATLSDELEMNAKLQKLEDISRLSHLIDTNQDGRISLQEMEANMQLPAMKALLNQIKVPMGMTGEELLTMLDEDGDELLLFDEVVRSFYRLVESDEFQRMCISQLGINKLKQRMKHQAKTSENILNAVCGLQDAMAKLQRDVHSLLVRDHVQLPPEDTPTCSSVVKAEVSDTPSQHCAKEQPSTIHVDLELKIRAALEQAERFDKASAETAAAIAGAAARLEFARCLNKVERDVETLIHHSVDEMMSHSIGVETGLRQKVSPLPEGTIRFEKASSSSETQPEFGANGPKQCDPQGCSKPGTPRGCQRPKLMMNL